MLSGSKIELSKDGGLLDSMARVWVLVYILVWLVTQEVEQCFACGTSAVAQSDSGFARA